MFRTLWFFLPWLLHTCSLSQRQEKWFPSGSLRGPQGWRNTQDASCFYSGVWADRRNGPLSQGGGCSDHLLPHVRLLVSLGNVVELCVDEYFSCMPLCQVSSSSAQLRERFSLPRTCCSLFSLNRSNVIVTGIKSRHPLSRAANQMPNLSSSTRPVSLRSPRAAMRSIPSAYRLESINILWLSAPSSYHPLPSFDSIKHHRPY